MKIKFNPSSNEYTTSIMNLLGQFALDDWKQQQKQALMMKNLEWAKKSGLFGDTSIPTSTDPFSRQPIPSMYPKGLDLETGMPQIGMRTPQDIQGMQFQQDVGRYKAAEQEYGLGKGMTKEKFTLMPRTERAGFIKNRLANFPGASGAMKELRPRFEGKDFTQDVEGRFKETPATQAVIDPETGEIIYTRPKGAVFAPKKTGGAKTLNAPMIDKISKNEDAYNTLGDAVTELQAEKDRFAQFMGPGKDLLRNPVRSYFNKDLQDFLAWKANVQDAFQQYRVAITGAQASDKEIALLAKNRPTENDTYEVFTKKAKQVRKVGNQVLNRYIKNLGSAGYNVSGYQDTLNSLNEELGNLTNQRQPTRDQFQVGQIMQKNGKTYKYIGNGQWSY